MSGSKRKRQAQIGLRNGESFTVEYPKGEPVAWVAEVLAWRVPAAELPDDDRTVMIHLPDTLSEPVWPGYYCDGQWYLADGVPVGRVLEWAPMPKGSAG